MTLIIDLPPEREAKLKAKARAAGLSAEDFARQTLERDLEIENAAPPAPERPTPQNLSELLLNSPFAGANLDLERRKELSASG